MQNNAGARLIIPLSNLPRRRKLECYGILYHDIPGLSSGGEAMNSGYLDKFSIFYYKEFETGLGFNILYIQQNAA